MRRHCSSMRRIRSSPTAAAPICAAFSMRDCTAPMRLSCAVAQIAKSRRSIRCGKVADPYRWMESLDSPDVACWVTAENQVTSAYLEKLPLRKRFKQRITELWDYPKVSIPVREGGRYFFQKNTGLQRQSPELVAL